MHPVTPARRIAAIDAIRGFALAGVLIVNLLSDFRIPLSSHILGDQEPLGPGGFALLHCVRLLIEFKAFALFSFLFGVGVAIQSERLAGPGQTLFLLRRFSALLAFGLAHMFFIWNGDILALYAVCGLVSIPLLKLRPPALAAIGAALILSAYLAPVPVPFPDPDALRRLSQSATLIYSAGSVAEIFRFRLEETRLLILPLLLLSFLKTLGLVVWGVAAWRCGLLQSRGRRYWLRTFVFAAPAAMAGWALSLESISTLAFALAYAVAILLWLPRASIVSTGIIAVGRMALTNYLLQSIVLGFAFLSYGFGLYGAVTVGRALAGGMLLYFAQAAFSLWWLTRFAFGPVEWLWRSISYLEWQPLSPAPGTTVPPQESVTSVD